MEASSASDHLPARTRWYAESMLEPVSVTRVRIQGLSTQDLKLDVDSSWTPAEILQRLEKNPLVDCFIYRQVPLVNDLSLAHQHVQNDAVFELSKRGCCVSGSLCKCRGGCVRKCIRSRCARLMLSQRNLANNGKNLRLMSFSLALICYVLLVSLIYCYLERWPFEDAFYFTWVMITTVGYGDITPKSREGRLLLIPLFPIGGIIVVTFLGDIQHTCSKYMQGVVAKLLPLICRGGRVLSPRKIGWIHLSLSIVLMLVWIFLGWAIFHVDDGFEDAMDFIYTSVVTFTTIGYGDRTPTTPMGKGFWFVYMIPGLVLMAVLLGYVDALLRSRDYDNNKKKDLCVKKRLQDLNGINTVTLKRTFEQLEHNVQRSLTVSELRQKVE